MIKNDHKTFIRDLERTTEDLSLSIERGLEEPEKELEPFSGEEDPLYEEARKLVVESGRASSSLLH